MCPKSTNLNQLLDQVEQAADTEHNEVSLDKILDTVGRRTFGPFLLIAGLVTLAPLIGDIPGVPTIMGILVLLVGGQLLFQHEHFWLPQWLLKQSISPNKICKALDWLRSPARFLDRWLRPRLTACVGGTATYVIAAVCVAIAAVMPAMEVIPFSANVAGIALTAFGLSLITNDGVMALLAFIFSAGTFGLVIYSLL
jgi:hypothetical protein